MQSRFIPRISKRLSPQIPSVVLALSRRLLICSSPILTWRCTHLILFMTLSTFQSFLTMDSVRGTIITLTSHSPRVSKGREMSLCTVQQYLQHSLANTITSAAMTRLLRSLGRMLRRVQMLLHAMILLLRHKGIHGPCYRCIYLQLGFDDLSGILKSRT